MTTARILEAERRTTQSGRAAAAPWTLEFERTEPQRPDPLTGWNGSGDTKAQVRIGFQSLRHPLPEDVSLLDPRPNLSSTPRDMACEWRHHEGTRELRPITNEACRACWKVDGAWAVVLLTCAAANGLYSVSFEDW